MSSKVRNKIILILSIGVFFIIFWGFNEINMINYKKHLEIKDNIVKHPESLPTKEFALKTSFGYKNMRADFYRLQAVQYIGGNAIGSEYKKYLFKVLDLITELNPSFEHPYIIGELLLPDYNPRYEELSKQEQEKNINQGIELGLKGIKNFCNSEKVEKIKKENNILKIITEEEYKNPCKTYSIPYYLAYIYFFDKKDRLEASNYYKVASANNDSVEGAKIMAAIMQGKGGNRGTAFIMFLDLATNAKLVDENCIEFSKYLQGTIAKDISKGNNFTIYDFIQDLGKIKGESLKLIQENRDKYLGKFDENEEKKNFSDDSCTKYVNKAVRELNIAYIENANEKFKLKNKGNSARNAKVLFEEKYMDFLPTDFQQYKDYGIIYEYAPELKTFDYKMGNY